MLFCGQVVGLGAHMSISLSLYLPLYSSLSYSLSLSLSPSLSVFLFVNKVKGQRSIKFYSAALAQLCTKLTFHFMECSFFFVARGLLLHVVDLHEFSPPLQHQMCNAKEGVPPGKQCLIAQCAQAIALREH